MAEHILEDEEEGLEVTDEQKIGLATWFLLKSPPGEIQQVAKSIRGVLMDERLFDMAAKEAFPKYNMEQMIAIDLADHSGQVLLTKYGAIDVSQHLDPRTAQVAVIDHVKQASADDELPSAFVEEHRLLLTMNWLSMWEEAFPKGNCAVYCTCGKDVESGGDEFELKAVISATKFSAQNFYSGSWRSVWKIQVNQELQTVEINGKINVIAHYFEEGNVQLETSSECSNSTLLQESSRYRRCCCDVIQYLESEYLGVLEELRRKLPVTRTRFSWNNALQLSLSREITKELSLTR
ncbi:hypothetical protein O6H91_09G008400 [Diphasiastrum complanatum]|uniref:Uncharacterized protein n=1 Tax=Diphasiastrum complanatum TaxID=34168 RepID=A0ACC2CL48_DIPCM|nr:hypothetical protein O6H91_09G008400 [Diphasiastrum complanatum]